MAKKNINLNYRKCQPAACNGGRCLIIDICPLGLFEQEENHDFPMINNSLCKGCAKCVTACPMEAVST